jgi:hypothetical protein
MRPLQIFGLTRIAYGAYVIAKPARGARSWLGTAGEGAGSEVLMRSVGARDAAIGAALATGMGSPTAIAGGAIALDLADLAATFAARSRLDRGQLVKVAAVVLTYAGITAALLAQAQKD